MNININIRELQYQHIIRTNGLGNLLRLLQTAIISFTRENALALVCLAGRATSSSSSSSGLGNSAPYTLSDIAFLSSRNLGKPRQAIQSLQCFHHSANPYHHIRSMHHFIAYFGLVYRMTIHKNSIA